MVDLCARTYRSESQAVDLLVCLERIACELDTSIAQNARVVAVVVAAMLCARTALNLHLVLVVLSLSAEDDAAPVARTTAACGLC